MKTVIRKMHVKFPFCLVYLLKKEKNHMSFKVHHPLASDPSNAAAKHCHTKNNKYRNN